MPVRLMSFALNAKEGKVQAVLAAAGPVELTLAQIAVAAWKNKGSKPRSRGGSHVRNSLRKLVRLGLAERVGSGRYKGTGRTPAEVLPPALAAPAERTQETDQTERTERTQRADQLDQAEQPAETSGT